MNKLIGFVMFIIGLILFLNIINISLATVQVYSAFQPYIVTYDFSGNSTAPALFNQQLITLTVQIAKDLDSQTDFSKSYFLVGDSQEVAAVPKNLNDKIITTSGTILISSTPTHIKAIIVVKRMSNGTIYTLTAEGYVKFAGIQVEWYLDGKRIIDSPQVYLITVGKHTIKMHVISGGSNIKDAYVLVYDHNKYGSFIYNGPQSWMTPTSKIQLSKDSSGDWVGTWDAQEGIWDIFGYYVLLDDKSYRSLSLIQSSVQSTNMFNISQLLGIILMIGGVYYMVRRS
jgi:hypothetical protein